MSLSGKDHEPDASSRPDAGEVMKLEDAGTVGIMVDLAIIAVCVILLIIFGSGGALGSFLRVMIAVGVLIGCVQAWKLLRVKRSVGPRSRQG